MSWLKAKDWATGVEYSSLFHSGLRAISLRPRAHHAQAYSSSSSSEENSSSGRTSSIASLSSCLLRRSTTRTRHPSLPTSMSTDSSPSPPPRAPKSIPQRPSSMFVRPTKEMADAWSSEESFFDFGEFPKCPDDEYRYLMPPIEIDGVRSLAGPRSFLVNLGEMDAFAVEESFLFPSSSPDAFLHHPVPRRERPVSTQTMPLSSRRTRETRWERSDCAWMLEESSPELKAQEFVDAEEEIRPDDVDEPHMADWRQFHLDLLQTIR